MNTGAACNCPVGIPANTMCEFRFSHAHAVDFTNLHWNGTQVLMLASGAALTSPIGGILSGNYMSEAIIETMPVCEGVGPSLPPSPPASPPPPPPQDTDACFLFVDYDISSGHSTGSLSLIHTIPNSQSGIDGAPGCASACGKDELCNAYKWCDSITPERICLARYVTANERKSSPAEIENGSFELVDC